MVRTIEGALDASGKRFAIVAGRFNRPLTERLVAGAIECLERHGCESDDVTVYWVPGSFELPQLVDRLAGDGRLDAVLALGVLIRGETPHFDFISRTITSELSAAAIRHRTPVAYGVITADTIQQADVRSGIKTAGKGWEAALAAIEMSSLVRTAGMDSSRT